MNLSKINNYVLGYITVEHTATQGTNNPSITANVHNTMSFTDVYNNIQGVSTSGGNQISLPKGLYFAMAFTQFAYNSNCSCGIRLRDVSNSITLVKSVCRLINADVVGSGNAVGNIGMVGVFEITGTVISEFQCVRSAGTSVGVDQNFSGEDEKFWSLTINKIG